MSRLMFQYNPCVCQLFFNVKILGVKLNVDQVFDKMGKGPRSSKQDLIWAKRRRQMRSLTLTLLRVSARESYFFVRNTTFGDTPIDD